MYDKRQNKAGCWLSYERNNFMNEKKDRRIRKSKEALKRSIIELMGSKPVNTITIKELVEEADLNRSTFYNYYSDIPDMLSKLERELYDEFLHTLEIHIPKDRVIDNVEEEAVAFIKDMCDVIKNNYDFCKCIFSKNGDINFMFELEELVENQIIDQLRERFDSIKHCGYVYAFFKSGYIGILKSWMKNGCIESSDEIARLTYALIGGILEHYKI